MVDFSYWLSAREGFPIPQQPTHALTHTHTASFQSRLVHADLRILSSGQTGWVHTHVFGVLGPIRSFLRFIGIIIITIVIYQKFLALYYNRFLPQSHCSYVNASVHGDFHT
jgi:hypothetical protein